jgi:hypothetical protein
VGEGGAEVLENLLQCLGVAVVEKGEVGMVFEEGQLLAHLCIREGFACLLVVVFASLQKVVPDKPTTACPLSEQAFLF